MLDSRNLSRVFSCISVLCWTDKGGLTLDGIGLKSTLHEVKEKIRDIKHRIGPVYVYFHEGREIRYDETSTTLEDIFGSQGPNSIENIWA